MDKIFTLVLCSFLLFFIACSNKNNKNRINKYYDLKGFFKKQDSILTENKALLKKVSLLNNKKDSQKIREINWEREFNLFRDLDINKPALRKSYNIKQKDSSAYRIIYYKAKTSDPKVRSIKILIDENGKIKKLKGKILVKNILYENRSNLSLKTQKTASGKVFIKNYHVWGYQDYLLRDKKNFNISGIVFFDDKNAYQF